MATFPASRDIPTWDSGTIATHAMLLGLAGGWIGIDVLQSPITGITGVQAVAKVTSFNYIDSRRLIIASYGVIHSATPGLTATVRLFLDGSEITRAAEHTFVSTDPSDGIPICMFAQQTPGAAGSASASVTVERSGAGTVDAYDNFTIVVLDVGPSS